MWQVIWFTCESLGRHELQCDNDSKLGLATRLVASLLLQSYSQIFPTYGFDQVVYKTSE